MADEAPIDETAPTEEKAPTDDLLASATRFARSGLGALLENDLPVFFLHSAIALEHLSKAQLASISLSLISGADFNSLLHACGHGKHAGSKRMKTIGLDAALERSGHFVSALGNDEKRKPLHVLREVRNGVAHLGQLESDDADEVLAPYLRACDHLFAEIPGAERESFWGEYLEVVDTRLSESAKEAEGRVAAAIAAASLVFKQRYAAIEEAGREAALASIEGTYDPERYYEQLVNCPACERLALVDGSIRVRWEADWDYSDGESWIAGVYPGVTFSPARLECRVCGLYLKGEEELRAAGVPESWELDQEDVDSSDFEEDWHEPDWDDWGQ